MTLAGSSAMVGALPSHAQRLQRLGESIRVVCADASGSRVAVVVESCWAPVMLVETGVEMWGAAQLDALARHRLGLLYGEPGDAMGQWDVRVDHRAGERWALVYGLSSRLRAAVQEALGGLSITLSAMAPALAWGAQRVRPERAWPERTGQWLWAEQDRQLMLTVRRGRPVGLNLAVLVAQGHDAERAATAERVRLGLTDASLPLTVTDWSSLVAGEGNAMGGVTASGMATP